jgi:hypothetical protein
LHELAAVATDSWLGNAHQDLALDIARLSEELDRRTARIDVTLSDHPCSLQGGDLVWSGQTEHRELRRQLGALRASVPAARSRGSGDPALFRAELATLLSFAKTLESDAVAWRAGFEAGLRELEAQEAASRAARERLTAEHDALIKRRDVLQRAIDATAARIARDSRGECRRTVPCVSVGDTVTVLSQWVRCPRHGFSLEKHWLVTLDRVQDRVLVRRCYA